MQRLEFVMQNASRETFLRGADALHLARTSKTRFTEVYSNERHFVAAAFQF